MSLLDSKKGLTILSALFLLIACEEPSELPLGISPKQGTVSSHYIEIPIETAQIWSGDSIMSSIYRTINSNNQTVYLGNTYIGKMSDPHFGTVKATAYTNIVIPAANSIPALSGNVSATSTVLSLKLTNNILGRNFSAPQTLKVYNLPEKISSTNDKKEEPQATESIEYRYFTKNTRELKEENLIGEVTFDTAAIKKNIIRIDLSDAFGQKIIEKIKENPATFTEQEAFNDFIGSLAIEAGETNTFIADYDITGAESKIELTTDNASSSVITFTFAPPKKEGQVYKQLPTYFSLETDYNGTALEGITQGTPFQTTDNQLYFRAGVGLLPKISFPELEEFVTSVTETNGFKVVVNSAVLEIDSIQRKVANNISAPSQLSFSFVKNQNNQRFKGVNDETIAGAPLQREQYVTSEKDTLFRYRADIADEVEWFINNKSATNSRDYLQGMLYPGSGTPPSSLSSLVAAPHRIVLKIYYTTLETNQGN